MGKEVLFSEADADLRARRWFVNANGNTHYALASHGWTAAHRIVIERVIGRKPEVSEWVDHINRNGLDNRRENLRLGTNSDNCRNRRKSPTRKTSSKYIGVHWMKHARRWRVSLTCTHEGRRKYLYSGYFKSEVDAARAYNDAAERFGFLSRNIITE